MPELALEKPKDGIARWIFRILLAIFYFIAGVAHLQNPDGFVAITPRWVPFPEELIYLTGLAEIAGAIGLFIPPLRRAAGIGLAFYALCVWPANFNHAFNNIAINGEVASWSYHGPRLAFQPVLIWWALWAGNVTNWPFRRKHPQD